MTGASKTVSGGRILMVQVESGKFQNIRYNKINK